jgi:DNA invertase Pin-like site-specific DNA recombinase
MTSAKYIGMDVHTESISVVVRNSVGKVVMKLMHQITGAVAEFERAKIVERNRRGKLYRARCGEVVTWRAPFGYVRIPRRDGVAPPWSSSIRPERLLVGHRHYPG